MPISVTKTESRTEHTNVLWPESLPVELYFKVVFDDPKTASNWCTQAAAMLGSVTLSGADASFQRFVVWGPKAPRDHWVAGGHGTVFISELALRVIRARGDLRVPGAEAVSLSQLDYDLHLYVGSVVDQSAYSAIRSS